MTEPHKRPHRHPKYTTVYRVQNWREYDQSLRGRSDMTLWISQDASDAWIPPQTGTRGAQPVYSDGAIEAALALRLLLHLPLRQTEGVVGSVLRAMGLALPCPDHTTLSRRHAAVVSSGPVDHAPQGPIDLIVDRTGCKGCGQGAWQRQKHGEKKPRRWKNLPIGGDAQGRLVASRGTESHAPGPSQVPHLLSQVDSGIARFIGEGLFDHASVSTAVEHHAPGAQVVIPPRQDAVLRAAAMTALTQRDQHVLASESEGRCAWQRPSGSSAQSEAEQGFSRGKRTVGGKGRSKRDAAQEREAGLAGQLLNRRRALGCPLSYAVS